MGAARPRARTASLTLDAGALIALDRGDRRMVALLAEAIRARVEFHVPAGVVGQSFRDGRRQATLSRFLKAPEVRVVSLDGAGARACGELCGLAGTADVIDASVVLAAREYGDVVLTSDPEDLLRLDPALRVEKV